MKQVKKELRFVYITCGSIEEAKKIGKILVRENLVACVNILRDMISIFRWEEKIVEASEVVMIAKTRKSLMPQLIEFISKNHSYDCPCILELPIQGGKSEFLKWIESET